MRSPEDRQETDWLWEYDFEPESFPSPLFPGELGWDRVDTAPVDHVATKSDETRPWYMPKTIVEDGAEDLPRRKKHARSPIPGEQAGLD